MVSFRTCIMHTLRERIFTGSGQLIVLEFINRAEEKELLNHLLIFSCSEDILIVIAMKRNVRLKNKSFNIPIQAFSLEQINI